MLALTGGTAVWWLRNSFTPWHTAYTTSARYGVPRYTWFHLSGLIQYRVVVIFPGGEPALTTEPLNCGIQCCMQCMRCTTRASILQQELCLVHVPQYIWTTCAHPLSPWQAYCNLSNTQYRISKLKSRKSNIECRNSEVFNGNPIRLRFKSHTAVRLPIRLLIYRNFDTTCTYQC